MALDLKVHDLQSIIGQSAARWTADITNLSHLSAVEKTRRLGAAHPNGITGLQQREAAAKQTGAITAAAQLGLHFLGSSWDWRNANGRNFVTPVRDQSSCGSCVAFGTIAATESMLRISQNDPNASVDLSEAQLFYCDACAQEHRNCDIGWWPDNALHFMTDLGVADENCFPYNPGNQPCNVCQDWQTRSVKVTGWHTISDRNAMKDWVRNHGPLITCFTVYDDFFSYRSGVYHHVTGDAAGGHCVCVVGFEDNAQCWICKNSWGPGWGDSGFFRIAYGECGIDSEMWAVEGVTRAKSTLNDTSRVTPALAPLGDRIVLGWTGTDSPSHLNVMSSPDAYHFGNKVTLPELSFDGPALASDATRLYLAWTGTDPQRRLNVLSSKDARTFDGKVTLNESGRFGPALACLAGRVYLAWVGTDPAHKLNVMSSRDGKTWTNKVTLNETSDSQIGLCATADKLYLVWQGTDPNSSLNLLESTDGQHWSNKITLSDSSDATPAALSGRELVLAWTGRDARHSINAMTSTSGSHGFGGKVSMADTATAGVALATFRGRTYLAWGGTDAAHRLNVMGIPQ